MEITYTLIRAKRKTISIKITDNADVVVRAPKFLSKKEIDKFVFSHSEWIAEKQAVAKRKQDILSQSSAEDLSKITMAKVMPYIEKYQQKMGKGPTSVKITSAKKRFGSCSSAGVVCFSKYLALYPDEAIEYVVVHELAHLFEMNHSKRFYAIIEAHLPDWKDRKNQLKL